MCERVQKGDDVVKYLKKLVLVSLAIAFSLSLLFPTLSFAEGDVTSDVTIGFSEKTIKDDTGKPKSNPGTDNNGGSNNNGSGTTGVVGKILPQTGEILSSPFTYVGLALLLGAVSYTIYKKKERV